MVLIASFGGGGKIARPIASLVPTSGTLAKAPVPVVPPLVAAQVPRAIAAPAPTPVVPASRADLYSDNPELILADQYRAAQAAAAANGESTASVQEAPAPATGAASKAVVDPVATSPVAPIAVAGATTPSPVHTRADDYRANPELILADQYRNAQALAENTLLSDNPELITARAMQRRQFEERQIERTMENNLRVAIEAVQSTPTGAALVADYVSPHYVQSGPRSVTVVAGTPQEAVDAAIQRIRIVDNDEFQARHPGAAAVTYRADGVIEIPRSLALHAPGTASGDNLVVTLAHEMTHRFDFLHEGDLGSQIATTGAGVLGFLTSLNPLHLRDPFEGAALAALDQRMETEVNAYRNGAQVADELGLHIPSSGSGQTPDEIREKLRTMPLYYGDLAGVER